MQEFFEGGSLMLSIVLLIALIFASWKWYEWRITATALVHWIEKNGHIAPSNDDLKRCVQELIEQLLKC